MRLKKWLGAAVSAVALAGTVTGVAIGGSGVADAATQPAGGTWGTAQPFPGFSARDAVLDAATCPSLGNCVVVGYTSDAVSTPIVGSQVNGRWGSSQALSWPASLGSGSFRAFTSVSCGAPGDCTAAGWYIGTDQVATAFYVSETAGAWGTPTPVASPDQPAGTVSNVNGLSCPAVGYCTIAGEYVDAAQDGGNTRAPFTLDEVNGTWGTPQPVAGLAGLPSGGVFALLNSVSCAAAGNCTASGVVGGAMGGDTYAGGPFVVTEAGGVWGNAQPLQSGSSVEDPVVSCPDAADCTVAGQAGVGVYTFDEANGGWGQGQALTLALPADAMSPPLLGCRSAGNCVIAGTMQYRQGTNEFTVPFAATETSGGAWQAADRLPGFRLGIQVGTEGLSCVPDGDCTIAGTSLADDNTDAVWTSVSGTDGSIGTLRQDYQSTGSTDVYSLSCPQDGYCMLGFGVNPNYMLGTEAAASTVRLTASAARVTYGAEQSQTLIATVSSAVSVTGGGTPAGTVTVTSAAGAPLCTITLAGGTGTCPLTPRQLPAGTSTLTASYSGDATYLPAHGAASVTVGQAATATRLSVRPGGITFSGTATRLAVAGTVSSTAGTPDGYATLRVDGHAIPGCINVRFSAGTVSCTGITAVLTGGKHTVTLSYSGGGNFAASASPAVALTVGVARSTPALSLSRSPVRYGSENAERFTVSVSHAGTVYPTGKAQVRTGRTTLCTVTLSSRGAGSCTLTAKRLRVGRYPIVAVYLGNANYHSSQSAGKTLQVAA